MVKNEMVLILVTFLLDIATPLSKKICEDSGKIM